MKKNTWFVVLTLHPDKKKLARLVERLSAGNVVVVDNTPGERSKRYIPTDMIFTGDNLGYAGGMNRGISYALHRGAKWVVCVNDDIETTDKAVSIFVSVLKSTPPGIAGPFSGRLDPVRWTSIYPAKIGKSIEYISGSFLGIHKNVFTRVGNFFEPYFIYYEDIELCLRAKEAGFPLTPILVDVKHVDTTTVGRGSSNHQYYLARNHLLFVERNAPPRVKIHEFLRLLKTYYEHRGDVGGKQGVRDYMLRRFGRRDQ